MFRLCRPHGIHVTTLVLNAYGQTTVLSLLIAFPAANVIYQHFLNRQLPSFTSDTSLSAHIHRATTARWSAATAKTGNVSILVTLFILWLTSQSNLQLITADQTTYQWDLSGVNLLTSSLFNMFDKPTGALNIAKADSKNAVCLLILHYCRLL